MARATRTTTNAPGLKFYGAIVAAIITYVLSQQVLDLPAWADVVLNAAAVGLAVWLGKPQPTVGMFALPGAVILAAVAAAVGDVHLLFAIIVVVFLLAAIYVAVRLREYVGAAVLVVCAILVAIFLL